MKNVQRRLWKDATCASWKKNHTQLNAMFLDNVHSYNNVAVLTN